MKENKTGVILLLITLIIFLISSIFIVERFRTDATPREPINLNEEEKTRTITSDRIEEIVVSARNANVIIETAEINHFEITYTEHDFLSYQFINEDNQFTINQTNSFNLLNPAPNNVYDLTIKVPNTEIYTLNIRTTNGFVSITNARTNAIDINTSNNGIILTNVNNANLARLRTTNGTVVLTDLKTDSLTLNTSNRRVMLNDVEANDISIRNVNASVSFSNLLAFDISIITSNSNVSGTIIGRNELFNKDIVTSNGTISLDEQSFGTILNSDKDQIQPLVVYTTHADITINFRELAND